MTEFVREVEWLLRDKYHRGCGNPPPGLDRDLLRLKKGEPLAYVIGWVDFLGARIDLRHKPLIPRPETEYWTELAIKRIGSKKAAVLDIFCGSGCVGLAVLKHCPNVHVTFADVSPSAMRQVRFNLKLNRIPERRFSVVRSDVWKNIPDRFDFVLANPPYIPSGRKLDPSVARFEPSLALFSGRKGDSTIRKFLSGLASHLEPHGEAVFEFDSAEQARTTLASSGALAWRLRRDQFGRTRFAIGHAAFLFISSLALTAPFC